MSTISQTLTSSRTQGLRGFVKPAKALELKDQVALALDTLRKNPLRSALTILGIVIGITTVIAVSSLINGLNENVLGGIRDLGSDTIIAYRFPWASLSRPPSEWFTRKELQPEWAEDIARLPHVKAASSSMRIFQPQFGSGTSDVRRGVNRAKNVILQGNEPSIGEIFDLKIQYGRFFNETDAEHKAPVVLLGYDTTRILFPDSPEHSIGQEVTIDGQLFTVIGIGVRNIMLVSVTERTREIGVRKAIGAKRSNILAQFLIEAVTLSAVGGVIGVLFVSGISLLLRYGLKMPAVLSFFWIAAALILCALIGVVFGVYPAWKAARLDPVEALRYE